MRLFFFFFVFVYRDSAEIFNVLLIGRSVVYRILRRAPEEVEESTGRRSRNLQYARESKFLPFGIAGRDFRSATSEQTTADATIQRVGGTYNLTFF